MWQINKFIYGKQKLKIYCWVCNVKYKIPQGTQERNGCPYPLWSMVLIFNGNCKTNIHISLKEIIDTAKQCGTTQIYILLHLSPEYWSLNELNGLLEQRKSCWEFISEHVHYINFGTQDIFTYVIFGIDIKCSCTSSL